MDNNIIIIGAGLCGLTLSSQLMKTGLSSCILEKSKSVGGRLATRRDGENCFDHGAQFYKHSLEKPFLWHDQLSDLGLSKLWFSQDQVLHYHVAGGMTKLAKIINSEFEAAQNIIFNEKIISLKDKDHLIEVTCESGQIYSTKKIIFTSPLPQSIEILRSSEIIYPAALENIKYAKSLVGLVTFNNEMSDVLSQINFLRFNENLFSISNNKSKQISLNHTLTIVMSPDWSEKNYEKAESDVLKLILDHLFQIFPKLDLNMVIQQQLKKWKYSHPFVKFDSDFLSLDKPNQKTKIILAGDAFGGASLHGAVQSAVAVAQFMK